jgi:nucleoid-associated protein YgaU
MDRLINKRSHTFDYISRYSGVNIYYDPDSNRDIMSIGKQIRFDTAYTIHKVSTGDTLDKLALTYYNNPTYWWAIAYFNKISDPFINLPAKYKVIKIPTISSIIFED